MYRRADQQLILIMNTNTGERLGNETWENGSNFLDYSKITYKLTQLQTSESTLCGLSHHQFLRFTRKLLIRNNRYMDKTSHKEIPYEKMPACYSLWKQCCVIMHTSENQHDIFHSVCMYGESWSNSEPPEVWTQHQRRAHYTICVFLMLTSSLTTSSRDWRR